MNRVFGSRPDGQIRISFFETDAQTLIHGLSDWRARRQNIRRISSWRTAWQAFSVAPTIDCICQFNQTWSLHTDNGETATTGLVYTMSRRLKTRAVRFCSLLPSANAMFPSHSMEYHDARLGEVSAIDRHVGVYADAKWKFITHGSALAFENTNSYRERSIKARVTFELLCGYASSMGLCLENENDFAETFVIENPAVIPSRQISAQERLSSANDFIANLSNDIVDHGKLYAVAKDGKIVEQPLNLKSRPDNTVR